MAEEFASKSLKSSVAQLCIPLGWQNANVSAIEVSNDIVKRFLQRVGTLAARFAELGWYTFIPVCVGFIVCLCLGFLFQLNMHD